MAFDINNAADLLLLKTEEATDPTGMDYVGAGTKTKKILELFNDPELNVGLETTTATLTVEVLFDIMVPSEFGGNQIDSGELMWITAILNILPHEPDKDIEKWKDGIIELLPNNSITASRIAALTRRISRAEFLFGIGDTVITERDWFAARDS